MQISPSQKVSDVRTGDLVRVRRRRWRVVDVRAHDTCRVLTLAGLGPDAGVERRVIAPFDTVDALHRSTGLHVATPRTWRRACRVLLADNTPPGGLRSARHARIDVLPHQLEPALAVLRGLGSRLLLADDVGLGKTIQAGLVLAELRARAAAERTLVLAPAGLREQWADELARRFDIAAAVIDAREMRRRLATLPVGVNPWSTLDVAVASIDYVKRSETLPAAAACRWDLLIVDEAHGVAGDSDRQDAVARLAANAAYVLLLTATPHNGDRHAFSSLCRLGAGDDPLLLFRRTRHDVRLGTGRRVHRLLVRPSAAELRMHALVARFSRAVISGACDDRSGASAAWLALTVLNKRALSSARSLERTVERRLASLAAGAADGLQQPALPLPDPDGETDDADRPPDLAGLALADPGREQAMLGELAAAARLAARHETKIAALARFINRVAEPIVVFTEYRDTLRHLQQAIVRPAVVLHGGLSRQARTAALDAFVRGRQSLLLTTDAAGEGLNLHHTCRIVISLELPWNPMRLEQRIGRVDRIGQRRTVHAVHLIARHTGEARILDRLRERIARAQADVGAADPVGDHDRAIARLVIDGTCEDEDAPPAAQAKDLEPTAPMVPISLVDDAAREAVRLATARRFTIPGDEDAAARLESDGAWLMFARRPATRAAVASRVLLILRAAFEDENGRLIESALIPVAIGWPSRRIDRCRLDELMRAAMPGVAARVDDAVRSWREPALAFTRAFYERRLARERAIVEARADSVAAIFQPGLFDRRADQHHLAAQTAAADAVEEGSRRLTALARAGRLYPRPLQWLLGLAP